MGEGPTCCCCIPIKAGVIVLAVLGLLGGLKTFVDGASFFVARPTKADLAAVFEHQGHQSDEAEVLAEATLTFSLGLSVAYLILGALHFILSIVLLKGVTDRKPAQLRMWVKVNIGNLIFAAAVLLIIAGIAVVAGVGTLAFSIVIALIVLVAWEGYYIYVVHKYAGIMEDEDRPMQGIAYEKP